MKLNYLYTSYLLLGCIACLFLYFDLYFASIGSRWLGLFLIGALYFYKTELKSVLFYLSLVFAGLGETFMVLDFSFFLKEISIVYIVYWWIVIFILKKSVRNVEYKIKKEHALSLLVSSMLIIYFTYEILQIVAPKIDGLLIYVYIYVFSFLLLLFYMGILCINKPQQRYSWLLFLLIAYVLTNILSSLDGLYFRYFILEQLGCAIQIAVHFLLLKFLITTDEEVVYID